MSWIVNWMNSQVLGTKNGQNKNLKSTCVLLEVKGPKLKRSKLDDNRSSMIEMHKVKVEA